MIERRFTMAGIPVFGMLAGILVDYQQYGSATAAFFICIACVIHAANL